MTKQTKYTEFYETRQGATSFIMVMFFTIIVGIIAVSFISVMLSNIMQSTNYDLSQSAYDSSSAGIEDAKVMLLKYNNCVAHSNLSMADCSSVVNALQSEDAGDDCNIVGKVLKRSSNDSDSDQKETKIQSSYGGSGGSSTSSTLDQAYTCVKVDTKVEDYLGKINNDSDFKIIPLRTYFSADGSKPSPVRYVQIEWFNSKDLESVKTKSMSRASGRSSIFDNTKSLGDASKNSFGSTVTYAPSLQIGLIQSGINGYTIKSFKSNYGLNASNRGLLLFDINEVNSDPSTKVIHSSNNGGFPGSAISGDSDWDNRAYKNPVNSPLTIPCNSSDSYLSNHQYACKVIIELPEAINAAATKLEFASDIMRYLTITSPYEGAEASFAVKMFGSKTGNKYDCSIDDNGNLGSDCEFKEFAGVQSKVDSTGRANDLFRRIEARVELIDVNYPYPKYALSVYCDDYNNCHGDEGKIKKNYWTSYNCFTMINGEEKSCMNTGAIGNNNFSDSATAGF